MIKFAWHIHDWIIVEPLTKTIETRRAYIIANKPPREHELRLRLLHEVKGQLPLSVVEVGKTYKRAVKTYLDAIDTHMSDIEVLHKQECPDCPWDGLSIFRKGIK